MRQKSVTFEDSLFEQRSLEFKHDKLKTIPENYDIPLNNTKINDMYSSSNKKSQFPNTPAVNSASQIQNNTFPRRKSTINYSLEHIYDEIHEKKASRK